MFYAGIAFAVLLRRDSDFFLEDLRKVGLRGKTVVCRNLRDRHIRSRELLLARGKAHFGQIIDRRLSHALCEGMREIKLIDMCDLGERVKRNILGVVGINVAFRKRTLLG